MLKVGVGKEPEKGVFSVCDGLVLLGGSECRQGVGKNGLRGKRASGEVGCYGPFQQQSGIRIADIPAHLRYASFRQQMVQILDSTGSCSSCPFDWA